MSTIKRYSATPDMFDQDGPSALIEVDHSKFDVYAWDIANFWFHGEELIDQHGKVLAALRFVASSVLNSVMGGFNAHGAMHELNEAEGFPTCEEMGVVVKEIEGLDLSARSIELKEVQP